MSKSKRELSVEEKRLWRRVAEGVRARKPMPEAVAAQSPSVAAPSARSRPAPPLILHRAAAPAPLANRAGDKRVRRGRIDVGATLDLHGHTQASARPALAQFLSAAQRRGDRAVIVVTGVGRARQGVLKRLLPEWLAERDLRGLVAGYAPSHRSHGGDGAYYVFLKRCQGAAG